MKLVNVSEMQAIERATDARGQSYAAMMDMAGRAVAETAQHFVLGEHERSVLVLVGPGNNGGDGLVASRYLLEQGHQITVYIWKRDVKGDENFRALKRKRRGLAILWADNDADWAKLREEIQKADLVIDAILGTGVARPIEGKLADLLAVVKEQLTARRQPLVESEPLFPFSLPRFPLEEATTLEEDLPEKPGEEWDDDYYDDEDDLDDDVFDDDLDDVDADYSPPQADTSAAGTEWDEDFEEGDDELNDDENLPPFPMVLAVDCPSGLNCDTGAIDPASLPADLTVTFAFPKWGQVEFPGAASCGMLGVADIGVPADLAEEIKTELIGPETVTHWLPDRPANSHKGTFGKAMIVSGSLNYTGAAYLCSSSAARAGAGLVTLAIPSPLYPALAGVLPETTWLLLPGEQGTHSGAGVPQLLAGLKGYDALLVGPGLTTSDDARAFVGKLFGPGGLSREEWRKRVAVDADALNILSGLPDWPSRLPSETILTPHPGEMARLTGSSPEEINSERIACARRWATEWGHVVVLKGAHTVVAAPDGRTAVLPFALPALATAGSGDVLGGAIVAMLAQGLAPFEAAVCGGYLHGHAGLLITRSTGAAGALARDIFAQFPTALKQLYGD